MMQLGCSSRGKVRDATEHQHLMQVTHLLYATTILMRTLHQGQQGIRRSVAGLHEARKVAPFPRFGHLQSRFSTRLVKSLAIAAALSALRKTALIGSVSRGCANLAPSLLRSRRGHLCAESHLGSAEQTSLHECHNGISHRVSLLLYCLSCKGTERGASAMCS